MRELKYPHFLKCIEFTDDIFWKNIFEELSFGTPPYNTFIRKDYIISNIKNKEFNYKINASHEPNIVYEELYRLFYSKFGLISDIQMKEDELNFENQNKKKVLKYSIIEEFCMRKREEHNLSIIETRKLINYINLSLIIRNINTDDIMDDDGYIKKIDKISFDDGMKFENIFSNTVCNSNDIISDCETICSYWVKYINNLLK